MDDRLPGLHQRPAPVIQTKYPPFGCECCGGDDAVECEGCPTRPAGDLVLTRDGTYIGQGTLSTTLHRVDGTTAVGVGTGITAPDPHWTSDCIEPFSGWHDIPLSILEPFWTRFLWWCGTPLGDPPGPASFYILQYDTEEECEAGPDSEAGVFPVFGKCRVACGPLQVEFQEGETDFGEGGTVYDGPKFIVSDGPPTSPPLAVDLCVVVSGPVCGDPPDWTPHVGATVNLHRVSDESLVGSGTTDADGRWCQEVSSEGGYRFSVNIDGCTGERTVGISACGGLTQDVEVSLVVCCAYLELAISGLYADEAGTTIDLEGATVTGLTDDPLTADVDGVVTAFIPTARMLSWPVVGGDCSVRRATVTITAPGAWLHRCVEIDLHCGTTELAPDTDSVTLLNLGSPLGVARYLLSGDPEGSPPVSLLCPDFGCAYPGWTGRGLVAARLVMTFAYLEYEYEYELEDLSGTALAWYNLLPVPLVGGSIVLDLDLALIMGNDPGTSSPFGPDRRVEWHGSASGNWTPRGGGAAFATHFEIWHNATGTRVRLETPGYDPDVLGGPSVITVPNTVPEGSPLGTADAIDLDLDSAWEPCGLAGGSGSISLPAGMDNGHGFRASWLWEVGF